MGFFSKDALQKYLNARKIFGINKRCPQTLFFQRCPVPSKNIWKLEKYLELKKMSTGSFFPKIPCALQKYLNTRNIFGIKKMPMGSFFPKMPCALQKNLNTRKILLDTVFSIKRGHPTRRLFADLIILIKKRLVPAVYLNLKH